MRPPAMTFLRPLSALAAVLVFTTLPACTSETKEEPSSAQNELANGLERLTVVSGEVAPGGSVKVGYAGGDAYAGIPTNILPYIGVKLVAGSKAGAGGGGIRPLANGNQQLSLDVAGDFPGRPDVLVVDSAFHVLAQTKGVRTPDGVHASLELASFDEGDLVLVQDPGWVQPMDFEVSFEAAIPAD